ncbi:Unknown protein [Striga hermonthica]|uniref:DUF7870 domain-containing protein n=1 Tax=Striga hermonthica TaxID=68872 RepID=A0A9N7MD13_STRHE|nr:Unknown protein [Striga hermonthica]
MSCQRNLPASAQHAAPERPEEPYPRDPRRSRRGRECFPVSPCSSLPDRLPTRSRVLPSAPIISRPEAPSVVSRVFPCASASALATRILTRDRASDLQFLRDAGVDLLAGTNPTVGEAGPTQTFDFVFLPSFNGIQMIDEIAKSGALVVAPLGHDPSNGLLGLPTDFKIVYLRRFDSTVVALRKIITSDSVPNSGGLKQVSCGVVTPEKKKEEALKGLEDVYLEPPRQARTKSTGRRKKSSFFTSRKIKFLPNLLKDSLDEYPRRVFISDDSRAFDWFYKNYPMKDQEFEVYHLGDGDGVRGTGSDWLRRNKVNVGPEDYVVMKAEAFLVEEMLRDRSLCLVDELFLDEI